MRSSNLVRHEDVKLMQLRRKTLNPSVILRWREDLRWQLLRLVLRGKRRASKFEVCLAKGEVMIAALDIVTIKAT